MVINRDEPARGIQSFRVKTYMPVKPRTTEIAIHRAATQLPGSLVIYAVVAMTGARR